MKAPVKMLVIYVDEGDTYGTGPLHEAIIRRLRQLGISGATAVAGIMGFGAHLKVHRRRLFGVADERPVVITVVDSEPVLREALPEIRGMVREGLMLLLDCEVIEGVEEGKGGQGSGAGA
jgi:PII-like signaling protein